MEGGGKEGEREEERREEERKRKIYDHSMSKRSNLKIPRTSYYSTYMYHFSSVSILLHPSSHALQQGMNSGDGTESWHLVVAPMVLLKISICMS